MYYNRWCIVQTQHLCAFSYETLGRQPERICAGTPYTGSAVHWNESGDGAENSWSDGMIVHICYKNMAGYQHGEHSAPSVQHCLKIGLHKHHTHRALCLQTRQNSVGFSQHTRMKIWFLEEKGWDETLTRTTGNEPHLHCGSLRPLHLSCFSCRDITPFSLTTKNIFCFHPAAYFSGITPGWTGKRSLKRTRSVAYAEGPCDAGVPLEIL